MTEYEDVKNYIQNKFGNFEGKKWIAYKRLNKHVYLDDTKVELCTLKDKKQYCGIGWQLKEVDNKK